MDVGEEQEATHHPHDTSYRFLLSSKKLFVWLLRSFIKIPAHSSFRILSKRKQILCTSECEGAGRFFLSASGIAVEG